MHAGHDGIILFCMLYTLEESVQYGQNTQKKKETKKCTDKDHMKQDRNYFI